MRKMSGGGCKVVSPFDFKNCLVAGWQKFSGGGQHDAHEFLMLMMDRLKTLKNRFRGFITTTSTCGSCGYEGKKSEQYYCLSIDIPINQSHVAVPVQDCVVESFADEVITEDWSCEAGCGATNTSGRRELYLSQLPDTLIIQLKRFIVTSQGFSKKQTSIDLQEGRLEVRSTQYRLVGVVNHVGSLDSGHYTASIKVNNRWKKCNDSRVRDDCRMEQKSRAAYLLFYERVIS